MKSLFAAALIVVVVSACGVEGGNGSEVKSQFPQGVMPADERLYSTPDYKPDGFCDLYTNLKLKNYGYRNVAQLENRLSGICEIAVMPNARSYELEVSAAGCGSLRYTSKETGENGLPKLVVIDHRTRLCDDLQLNTLVVKELDRGKYNKMYSSSN